MSHYLDASVIVPTLVDEPNSPSVATFLARASAGLVVSDFTAAEVASALSRLVRMALLSQEDAVARLREFDVWRVSATETVDFQPSDFRLCAIFVRNFDLALRAPDAAHAAVCHRNGFTLITLDQRLAAAAGALGVNVAIP